MGAEGKPPELITAVYKLNLHCPQCARAVEKHLTKLEGVQEVQSEVEAGKVSVKGKIDALRILEQIEKKCKRRVELVSPLLKKAEAPKVVVEKKVIPKKEVVVKTTALKVDMHCGNCEHDLKRKLLELEGVHFVNTNREEQTCTVEGTMEPQALVEFLHKKLHKHAEVIPRKEETVKEKKQQTTRKEAETKKVEISKEEKKVTVSQQHFATPIATATATATAGGGGPYFLYYGYEPNMFSDENPNACAIL